MLGDFVFGMTHLGTVTAVQGLGVLLLEFQPLDFLLKKHLFLAQRTLLRNQAVLEGELDGLVSRGVHSVLLNLGVVHVLGLLEVGSVVEFGLFREIDFDVGFQTSIGPIQDVELHFLGTGPILGLVFLVLEVDFEVRSDRTFPGFLLNLSLDWALSRFQ